VKFGHDHKLQSGHPFQPGNGFSGRKKNVPLGRIGGSKRYWLLCGIREGRDPFFDGGKVGISLAHDENLNT